MVKKETNQMNKEMVSTKDELRSVDVEVYVTMPKKDKTGRQFIVRKREVDVGYVGYPVEVFVNGKLVYSTEE